MILALIPHLFSFVFPLFCGNVLHLVVIKLDLLPALTVPLSAKYFGKGKTYRGFLALPLLTALASGLFGIGQASISIVENDFLLGAILGFVYMLGELPNSFIKRKLGIQSGQSTSKYKFLQAFVDKLDSLTLLAVAYYFLVDITLVNLCILIALSFGMHVVFSFLFFKLKLKKSF
jgi:hypothetical protein